MTVGRGFGSDVVLDDPYACASHLRIVEGEDGELRAEDAGSVNGIRERIVTGKRATLSPPAASIALRSGTELMVGRTRVRVRTADEMQADPYSYRDDCQKTYPPPHCSDVKNTRWLGGAWTGSSASWGSPNLRRCHCCATAGGGTN